MSNRGRPRTPDILTPREYEVLDFLRRGLSNREIADRLGISLAGAKFHVSEIITKLGVESREEAAAWRPEPARRWGFAPLATLTSWSQSLPALLTPKAAAASLAVVLAAGISAAVLVSGGNDDEAGPGGSFAVVEPTPTPEWDGCATLPTPVSGVGCVSYRPGRLQFASLEEAAEETSFVPRLPEYLPPGYERKSLDYMWPVEASGTGTPEMLEDFDRKGPSAPFEHLVAEFSNPAGKVLRIMQGYALGIPGLYDETPEAYRGSVHIGGREVRWYTGNPEYEYTTHEYGNRFGKPVPGAWEASGRAVVFWTEYGAAKGTAWEIAPDGTKRVFEARRRPFQYVIFSEALPVEELLKIAASVPP